MVLEKNLETIELKDDRQLKRIISNISFYTIFINFFIYIEINGAKWYLKKIWKRSSRKAVDSPKETPESKRE